MKTVAHFTSKKKLTLQLTFYYLPSTGNFYIHSLHLLLLHHFLNCQLFSSSCSYPMHKTPVVTFTGSQMHSCFYSCFCLTMAHSFAASVTCMCWSFHTQFLASQLSTHCWRCLLLITTHLGSTAAMLVAFALYDLTYASL